jgi:hypothetical protein
MDLEVNEGRIDRIFRLIFGVIFLLVGLKLLTAPLSYVAYIIAIILLFTGLTGHCSLYSLFGISTVGNPLCDFPIGKKKAERKGG